MFIVRHYNIRVGNLKSIRKIVFEDRQEAIKYISELREHETLILFKEEQRTKKRRNNE